MKTENFQYCSVKNDYWYKDGKIRVEVDFSSKILSKMYNVIEIKF